MLGRPTMIDTAPTVADETVTMEPAEVAATDAEAALHDPNPDHCVREIGTPEAEGNEAAAPEDAACVDMVDATPMMVGPDGAITAIGEPAGATAGLIEQRLQERRLEIDDQAAEVDAKQAILDAAEKRIEERMATLDTMQKQIEASEAAVAEAAAQQLKDMIAVYEGMKPTSAAQIFDELPDETLVALAKDMNPRKLAPILAKMNPQRAGALTVLLGSQQP